MDANGLRAFGLRPGLGFDPWRLPDASGAPRQTAEIEGGVARLAGTSPPPRFRDRFASPADVLLAPALARDADGNYAAWDGAANRLVTVSALAARVPEIEPVPVTLPPSATPVRDLAYGANDVLFVAGGEGVLLLDTRGRFPPTPARLDPAAFTAGRLAATTGAVFALDTGRGLLCRITGLPRFETGVALRRDRDDRFSAVDPNPKPLAAIPLPAALGGDERAVSIAAAPDGVLALLALTAEGARLRLLRPNGALSAPIALEGPRFPHALAWLDGERIAILAETVAIGPDDAPAPGRDLGAFVYRLPAAVRASALAGDRTLDPLAPQGDLYPLPDRAPGPFANLQPGLAGAFYPRRSRFAVPAPAPLARLALPAHEPRALLANFPAGAEEIAPGGVPGRIDSGSAGTVWHRLEVEARVPPGTALLVWLAATDGSPPPFDPAAAEHVGWFPHLLGDPAALPSSAPEGTPRAAWKAQPAHLLPCPAEPGRSGVFSVLIQRAGRAVRTLAGRRLWVAVELVGDGRATPVLAALRATASRVSLRDRRLPALYRERTFGLAADAPGRATGPDFLERFTLLLEGLFTEIEDAIVAAPLLTDARACPDDALPWLASWIGLALEPGLPSPHARAMLLAAPDLARRHGTLAGLAQSLDIATGGAVRGGRVVPFENYRLRRTVATLLGTRLEDRADPLTAGLSASGHSVLGDSLILGDEHRAEVLALFRTLEPAASGERDAAFAALYDGLAHRATVLVHDATDEDETRLVRRLAEAAAPAHVEVAVVPARYPFLVAVASLVGVDSYLRPEEQPDVATLGRSRLGWLDTVSGEGGLSDGALPTPADDRPVAAPGIDRSVPFGETFTLDASASRAAPGRTLDRFAWTHRET